jgi:hypothetical protein
MVSSVLRSIHTTMNGRQEAMNGAMNSGSGFGEQVLRMVAHADSLVLRDEEVFVKTKMGRIETSQVTSNLPRRLRMLLILVDGRRTMGDFRRGLTRFRSLDECFDMLRKMGYIEPLPVRLDL